LYKKTKIICTVGPASSSKQIIEEMHEAGMNGVRINTAYGNLATYKSIIETVREIGDIPIIIDIKGPEIRIRSKKRRVLDKDEILEIGFGKEDISFNHDFYDQMEVNDEVYIDNGKIRTRIIEKKTRRLRLLTLDGGTIEDGKGVNIPKKHLSVPTIPNKDEEIIRFAEKHDAEYIALSFTRNAQDIENLIQAGNFEGAIIAKIENSEGVKNAEEILNAADGLMVARGDLGVEIPPERVPLIQKSLIRLCNQKGKPVVTATEMLESMMHEPLPTRAEVSDVANAILDGTDATMLSGETAVGEYPVESVAMMARIAAENEKAAKSNVEEEGFINISDTISKAVQKICLTMPITKVVTLTRSGYTARMIARFKISQPIIAVTPDEKVKKQLELVFGVYPAKIDYQKQTDHILCTAKNLYSMNLINDDDTVLFTAAFRTLKKHASNLIEIHKIENLKNYNRN